MPKQWALDDVDTEATVESWITLEDNCAQVRHRLTNNRADTTQYSGRHQELPAVYATGRLGNLYTYTGLHSFTGDTLTQITNIGPPWEYWNSTENWSAHVDDSGWGLGIFHPGVTLTVGGFAGTPGSGGPSNGNTGYLAPLYHEIIDHDIAYEYQYTLVLRNLDEIRDYAYAHQPDPRPHYVIDGSRQHLYYNWTLAIFQVNPNWAMTC